MPRALFRQRRWIVGSIAWALATGLLAYGFIVASHPIALLCGFGIAVALFVLRKRALPLYGLIELLAGALLLARAVYAAGMGRGPFSDAFSDAFDRFDLNVIALQSYGALFLLIRGLDNIWESRANLLRACSRLLRDSPS